MKLITQFSPAHSYFHSPPFSAAPVHQHPQYTGSSIDLIYKLDAFVGEMFFIKLSEKY